MLKVKLGHKKSKQKESQNFYNYLYFKVMGTLSGQATVQKRLLSSPIWKMGQL